MKLNLLAITAHPDDVELCCAGTLLKHLELGYTVGLVELTQGELGTRGNAPLRLKEARAAADVMGIAVRENLGLADGFFTHDKESQLAIARMVRKYQPDIVITNAVHDRHPDHARASKLVSDACFYAGLVKVQTEHEGKEQKPWRPRAVYHIIQDYRLKPDFCVDVTPFMEKRLEAIRCFASQFYDPNSSEPVSPISGKEFMDVILANARVYGRSIGVEFGEGFMVERPVGVRDMMGID